MKLRSVLFALLAAVLPLAVCAQPGQAAAPVAGTDYTEIPGGKPFAPVKGKVEVVEVFGYVCIHCAHFEPVLEQWQKKQPAWVELTLVPAAFGGYWIPYAKAYYAAEQLGVAAASHAAMFRALHDEHSLPIQNASDAEIAGWYAQFGPDPDKFAAAMESPQVTAKLLRARDFAMAAGVDGTPTLIVNGRWRVHGRDFQHALRITDWLVQREHAGAGK
ncbi:MAG: thiol:disulfide interchange protein DsbA/DsbL [Pseudoxanthomonas sp.]